ncbi:hypothetical protein [Pseudoalteromonas sp. H103]|uniref:hypothetical protein n=1 Tax=Pseudoalteromonas sp. H103 TaxID=1761893 RepID=UPI0007323243|nr:hypothetical protein [Pseudoalteromonas sp. H103]KTF13167.1 hypothetical protein ATS74_19395 [Pseudoalteromonas sp. H103]
MDIIVLLCLLFVGLSISIFKSRLIQLILIFFAYPIFVVGILTLGGESSRIVAAIGDSYYVEFYFKAFIYQVITYSFFFFVLFSVRKYKFDVNILKLDSKIRLFLLILLFVLYPIAYPGVFGLSESRFGSGGSLLIVINSLLLMSRLNYRNFIDVSMVSINLFAFFMGERADIIILLLLVFILKSNKGRVSERNISNLKFLFGIVVISMAGLLSGVSRAGNGIDIDIQKIITYFISQGTAVDVIHVYLSSFWYVDNFGYSIDPILNIIFSFIPLNSIGGASSNYNVTEILRTYIPNVGGGLFYSAFYLSGGVFSMAIFSSIFSFFIKYIFYKESLFNFLFIALLIQQLRIQWYGINYLGNVISIGLIVIFFIYLINIINKKRSFI